MSKWTKADIDALMEGMDRVQSDVPWSQYGSQPGLQWRRPLDLRTALYLAVGLTATGERKPEKVRAQLVFGLPYDVVPLKGYPRPIHGTWDGATFVPDKGE